MRSSICLEWCSWWCFREESCQEHPHPFLPACFAEATNFPATSWNNISAVDSPAIRGGGRSPIQAVLLLITSVLTANEKWGLNTCARASMHVAVRGIIPVNVNEWTGTMKYNEWVSCKRPFMRPEWQLNSKGRVPARTVSTSRNLERTFTPDKTRLQKELKFLQLALLLGILKQEKGHTLSVGCLRRSGPIPRNSREDWEK